MRLNRQFSFLTIIAIVGVSFLAVNLPAQNSANQQQPGLERYTVSNIEWITLQMQAYHGDTSALDDGFRVNFYATGPQTITIFVFHLPTVDRPLMSKVIEQKTDFVKAAAQAKGWDWIEIKEKYTRLDK